MTLDLVGDNRYVMYVTEQKSGETRPARAEIGHTRAGIAFAAAGRPECIVTGGRDDACHSQRQTYYVCCPAASKPLTKIPKSTSPRPRPSANNAKGSASLDHFWTKTGMPNRGSVRPPSDVNPCLHGHPSTSVWTKGVIRPSFRPVATDSLGSIRAGCVMRGQPISIIAGRDQCGRRGRQTSDCRALLT